MYWGEGQREIAKFERAIIPKKDIGVPARKIEEVYRRNRWMVMAGSMLITDVKSYTDIGVPVQVLIDYQGCGHWVLVFACGKTKLQYMCPVRGVVTEKIVSFIEKWDRAYSELDLMFPFYGIVSYK